MERAFCTAPLDLAKGPPEWVQLLPIGEVSAIDGRRWHLADAEAVIRSSLPGLEFLCVDFDHAVMHNDGRPKPAAGWIKELAARAGFITGRVEWTPRGIEALSNREYRFISPVFTYDKEGTVTAILGAGLTNTPALRVLAAVASAEGPPLMNQDPYRTLCAALGLPADAAPEAALARAEVLAGQKPDPSVYVARAEVEALLATAAEERRLRDEERIARKIQEAGLAGKVVPAIEAWAVALCRKDEASFDEFIAKMPPIVTRAGLINFVEPRAVSGDDGRELTGTEAAVCTALGIERKALLQNLPNREKEGR